MQDFKDLFSGHAKDYARYRPHYPSTLFEYLSHQSAVHDLAWDCGTGNGQAAVELARTFKKVIGTDPSAEQIAAAAPAPHVEYRVAPAEKTDLLARSVDLITVAQALHWFKHDQFNDEVRRVAKPGAILAVWSYNLAKIDSAVDAVTLELYEGELGKYWEPERRLVEQGYAGIELPLENEENPDFAMTTEMNLDHWLKYLATWSAFKTAVKKSGTNPIEKLKPKFEKAWGNANESKTIRFPLTVRMGKVAF